MTTITHNSIFWKIAAFYGGLAGLLIISLMIGSFTVFGLQSGAASQAVGFLLMFFVLSLIFFGIKRYRDQQLSGQIKFSKAILLGLTMSVFGGLVYVLVWEIYTAVTNNTFIVHYTDHLTDLQIAKGIMGAELEEFIIKMETMKANYSKPIYRMGLTFAEMFPMGMVVSLISALSLHKPKFWSKSKLQS